MSQYLKEQPDDIEPIEMSHFDMWFPDDEDSPDLDAYDNAELEAEIARLNAIIEDIKTLDNVFGVDDKKDKLKIAVEYLEQECGNRCNAEYNQCAARQVLQQIEKED